MYYDDFVLFLNYFIKQLHTRSRPCAVLFFFCNTNTINIFILYLPILIDYFRITMMIPFPKLHLASSQCDTVKIIELMSYSIYDVD